MTRINQIKKEPYFYDSFTAGDRNRTGTGIATHGILSPGRLPVPPRRRLYQTAYAVMIKWDL